MAALRWEHWRKYLTSHLRAHLKTAIALLVFAVLWIAMVGWLWQCKSAAIDWKLWIETFNGATWPDKWADIQNSSPFGFAVVVATRTVANAAGPIGGIAAAIWFISGGLERYVMKMSSTEQMRLLNGELIPALSTYLQTKGYQIKKVDEEGMLKVADEVLDDLARQVEQHAESTRPRAQAR